MASVLVGRSARLALQFRYTQLPTPRTFSLCAGSPYIQHKLKSFHTFRASILHRRFMSSSSAHSMSAQPGQEPDGAVHRQLGRVAVAQMTATGDSSKNFDTCSDLARQAADAGCALLCLPECFSFIGGFLEHRKHPLAFTYENQRYHLNCKVLPVSLRCLQHVAIVSPHSRPPAYLPPPLSRPQEPASRSPWPRACHWKES